MGWERNTFEISSQGWSGVITEWRLCVFVVCGRRFSDVSSSHGAARPMVAKLLSLVYEKRYCVRSERTGKVGWGKDEEAK